jgi:ABC-type branched-subunit amino acid transport system substrate-binding protein
LVAVPVITVLRNKGAKSVFIWYEDQPYTESIAEGASDAAKQSAMNVTRYIKLRANPSVTDFAPIIDEIIATGPDVVIGGTYYDSCKRFLQELERRNFAPRAMFLTTCSADSRYVP